MLRRSVLKGVVASGLGAFAAPPLAAADFARADRKAAGQRVDRLEVHRLPINRRGDWLLLRLHSDGGVVGIGDASHGGGDESTLRYLRQFADLLRGRSIFDVEWLRSVVAPTLVAEKGKSASAAASALEHCLWDLMGKTLGVPSFDLLGGALRRDIPLYANINRSTDPRTPDGFAAMAQRAVAAGFGAVKLAPFDEIAADLTNRRDYQPKVEEGIASIAAVRAAIGPERKLLVDAHSRFERDEGIRLAERLEPFNLYWLEEVTPAQPIDNLAAIRRAARMPTAGGESVRGIAGFYPYVVGGAVDILMPDVKICGGILELKKIAALGEAAGLPVSPHGPASPVGNLAAGHVCATLPNFTILEFAFGEVDWRSEVVTPEENVEHGMIYLTDRPGFGAELNLKALSRHGSVI